MSKRGKKTEDDEALLDERPKKSAKAENDSEDSDRIVICELSNNRKVSVRTWQGKVVVDIREFYSKDGKEYPGKKAKNRNFFESVGNFFTDGDQIPWCDSDIVAGCEREIADAEKGSSDEAKSECIMRLSWALVHSRRPDDVQRGIAMLEGVASSDSCNPQQLREKLYLLAVGYYRNGDYSRSRKIVDRCLESQPNWRQAQSLKRAIEDKITKDGVIGIGIVATTVGLVAGGLAAALSARKK